MKKYKCSCGTTWFSDESNPECDNDDEQEEDVHTVKEIKTLTSSDYVELWEDDLENANRHSLTEMPSLILAVLSEKIDDKKIIRSVMKRLYELEIGV